MSTGIVKAFYWSKIKEKTSPMNLGKIIFNDYCPSIQIAAFGGRMNDSSYIVAGGFYDNSFKIISKVGVTSKVRHSIYFHKVSLLLFYSIAFLII